MESLSKKLFRYFLNGIFVIVPFVVTIILVFYPLNMLSHWIASFMNKLFRALLTNEEARSAENGFLLFVKRYLNAHRIEQIDFVTRIPYISLFIMALVITFFGFLASNVFIQSGVKLIERTIVRIPGISFLYAYVKESTAAFVGKFNKPVLVTINRDTHVQKIGFITQEHVHNLRINGDKIAVYVPHSYALSGELLFVDTENVLPLSISTTEAWKIILSGGIAEPRPKRRLLPNTKPSNIRTKRDIKKT